ncbi:hypothetical protein NCCP28_00310 [Niallia sp. NCCP-28]|nr:hypothetical protein NCCP28_00310 [Niallia sp. NCCP-28]
MRKAAELKTVLEMNRLCAQLGYAVTNEQMKSRLEKLINALNPCYLCV